MDILLLFFLLLFRSGTVDIICTTLLVTMSYTICKASDVNMITSLDGYHVSTGFQDVVEFLDACLDCSFCLSLMFLLPCLMSFKTMYKKTLEI